MDKYKDFKELSENENQDKDYTIFVRKLDSEFAIMAPHGGGIEPGTSDIADAIAADDYTFYAFKGIKKAGNSILHLTSSRYDEPAGLKIAQSTFIVISVHGARDTSEMIFIGGRNHILKQKVMHALTTAGFNAVISDITGLRGINPENICNRCIAEKGVQLEISRGLREKMFEHFHRRSLRKKTNLFYHFINTIKESLSPFSKLI